MNAEIQDEVGIMDDELIEAGIDRIEQYRHLITLTTAVILWYGLWKLGQMLVGG